MPDPIILGPGDGGGSVWRRVQETLEDIAHKRHHLDAVERPTDPWTNRETIAAGTVQGASHDVDGNNLGASADLDLIKNRGRDHLAPATILRLPTYTLVSGLALRIPLPREARSIIAQNNSDKGGTSADIAITFDGSVAAAGDYLLRSGVERVLAVYSQEIWLYQTSGSNIDVNQTGTLGGLVLMVTV